MTVAIAFNLKRDGPPDEAPESRAEEFYLEADSEETIEAVRASLAQRHEVFLIEAAEDAYDRFRELRPDFVFNMAEGLWGNARESQIPAMLEMLRIPYTGSDPGTLAICLDKVRTKQILAGCGIRVPRGVVLPAGGEELLFPGLLKPAAEGSSKFIYDSALVSDLAGLHREAARIPPPVLFEEFLPGREFTVAMLGNGEDVRCLPIVEIRLDRLPAGSNPIYSYEAKWVWDRPEQPLAIFECPARIDAGLESRIGNLCRRCWIALQLRDWARIDLRLDARGEPAIIEVNPIPGILPRPEQNSCFPKAARTAGMDFASLVNAVLDTALARHSSADADRRISLHQQKGK